MHIMRHKAMTLKVTQTHSCFNGFLPVVAVLVFFPGSFTKHAHVNFNCDVLYNINFII